jgi:hypothetical protein
VSLEQNLNYLFLSTGTQNLHNSGGEPYVFEVAEPNGTGTADNMVHL